MLRIFLAGRFLRVFRFPFSWNGIFNREDYKSSSISLSNRESWELGELNRQITKRIEISKDSRRSVLRPHDIHCCF